MTIGDGHDLKSSRFAGDEVLEACYDNERVLRRGDSGPAVEKIQQALIFLGFPVPKVGASGIFGDETELAVRSYQEARGLKVDGIAGPDTIGNLDSEFYTGPTEHRVTPAPEPQVSKVKTPLEPESPVRPAHASPLGPVRAPEVPRVRAPEVPRVRAPPVPVPETPELATKVTRRSRPSRVSQRETPPTILRPHKTDRQGRVLISEGTWKGDRYLEVEAGKSIHFEMICLNVDGSKVRIQADTGETKEYILSPGVAIDVDFSRAGQEPFIWTFDIETDSEKSLIDWKLYSDWVPANPDNPIV